MPAGAAPDAETPAYDVAFEVDPRASDSAAEPDLAELTTFAATVLAALDATAGAGVTVVIGDDDRLRTLNREHRGRDEPTDVLSFPAAESEAFPGEAAGETDGEPPYLGDIAISLPLAARQAQAAGIAPDLELRHLLLHGLLHLLGRDHETTADAAEMAALEERFLGVAIHGGGE